MAVRFILRGVGMLAAAFILTSAAMFWLPLLKRVSGYNTSYDYGGGYTSYGGGYNTSYTNDVQRLQKLSPIEERQALDEISTELREKTNAELYQMRAFADVCTNSLVDCRGLASTKVKPFIDATLSDRQATVSDRQAAETALNSRAANIISAASLFVSFVALIFTGLAYRRHRATKMAK